jgi:hypothetical protein
MSANTRRRAVTARELPAGASRLRLAMLMIFSTNGRRSFALGTVVWMCSYFSSADAWLRSMEIRCSVTRPSFRYATL